MAKEILEKAKNSKAKLFLPKDVKITTEFKDEPAEAVVAVNEIPADKMALDIGEKTIEEFKAIVASSKTVVWNGPMGVFEFDNYADGTNAIAEALVEATTNGAVTVIGGGDSAAAIKKAGLDDKVSHVSTGGGASLEFLEGKILPGVEALSDLK
jgi:phosphoglycerate kinase